MRTPALTAAALAATVLLAGCSAASDPAPTPTGPTMTTITVEIVDSGSLDVYFNLDDQECIGDYLGHEEVQVPEITISDGAGTILAVQDGPERGGVFTENSGCAVEVEFPRVPVADIYVVTVKTHDGTVAGERTVNGTASKTISVEV